MLPSHTTAVSLPTDPLGLVHRCCPGGLDSHSRLLTPKSNDLQLDFHVIGRRAHDWVLGSRKLEHGKSTPNSGTGLV